MKIIRTVFNISYRYKVEIQMEQEEEVPHISKDRSSRMNFTQALLILAEECYQWLTVDLTLMALSCKYISINSYPI